MNSSRLLKAFAGLLLLAATVGAQTAVSSNSGGAASALSYPAARRGDTTDDYFGTKVADPYRWLEDLDSPETRAWVEAENKLTFDYLGGIPQRAAIKDRLTKLWNYERYGTPSRQGSRYVYGKNNGLQNQSVLYVSDTLEGAPRVLLDPNTLSSDGTVALAGVAFTDDGSLMSYGLASSGSDWNEIHVRDVATGKDLPDVVNWVKFSGASWSKDGKGFYYSRYDEPKAGNRLAAVNEYHKVYYHRLGTPQAQDALVYSDADAARKGWIYNATVTEDGRYLVINLAPGSAAENRVYYKDLSKPDAPFVKLLDDAGIAQYFLGNDGPVFWFLTDRDAPRKRVIAVDTRSPEQKNWKTVIAEGKDAAEDANVVGDQFIVSYLTDAHRTVKVYDLGGKFVRDIELPGIGEAVGFGGRRKDKETFYSYRSFTTPATVYRYDTKTGKSTVFRQPKVDFNPADYETRQVFYKSKDGTRVPMFITSKKGLKLDGNNPTLLYAYGGFDIAETPAFSVSNLVWMEMGGVYAQPNLRGGGEYG
ncbi:MAG TPA: hypothetical protein VNZ44_07145, partial [Pyrinomonadaceae bacterium]|nr:hypothetical protein [Pyrinomonadaceae bacterium]